ncbi:MAG: cation:proton antiporter [Bacteroidales bacterium]|mgnify:CR=1 FL=1|nr:cation:proton antiporter [Bacteroidales bacterium]HOY39183.1 cation:proton antiporter [Bacteroidales bacterium]
MQKFLENIAHEFQTPFQNYVLVFAVMLFIILLIPLFLRKIRIPGIIGLIISGILIGPHGFNIIEKNSAVDLFSTIGLLYIMFIVGLELDLAKFIKNKYKSFVFGFFTFAIPIAIGFPVCFYLLHYPLNTSILVATMFATHTLIAYPIVSKLGIAKNEAVAITVGGTIFTDTAVLVALAIITGSDTGFANTEFLIRLGIAFVVYILFVIFVVYRVSRWFFKHLEEERNSQFIFVLSVVFLCAFLAEIAGLEPIIGAFTAGFTLNRLIPQTSSLMNRLEFVGNSLFIPFFLIGVGMIVDPGVFLSGPETLIVAGILTVVALIGKWLAALLTQWTLRYNSLQRKLIFGLSSSHAAAILAVTMVGHRMGIIDDTILNGTIILILITCIVASMVTENVGKKIVVTTASETDPETPVATEKILVPVSNPETMPRLIDLALMLKTTKKQVPVYGLTVVEDDETAREKLRQSRKVLTEGVSYAAASEQHFEVIATIDQNVVSGIKRVAREISATDIVLGSSGKTHISELFFGKTVTQIVSSTDQAIYVYNAAMPLNVHKHIHLACPRYSEKEPGFFDWLEKVVRIATLLNLKTDVYSDNDTCKAIEKFIKYKKMAANFKYRDFDDWEDFLVLSRYFGQEDLLIVVTPRKPGVSHSNVLDGIPAKLARHFAEYSFLVVYPAVNNNEEFRKYSENYDASLIEKGIRSVKKSAEELGKLFKT